MAYYATRGILPSQFLTLPKLDQLFLVEAMIRDFQWEKDKFTAYAKAMGAKIKSK